MLPVTVEQHDAHPSSIVTEQDVPSLSAIMMINQVEDLFAATRDYLSVVFGRQV